MTSPPSSTPLDVATTTISRTKPPRPRRPNYNYIHRNLLPIDIHPLPVLIPHNPLSLVAIALSYIAQIVYTPRQPVYDGYFSSATSSIHVTDPTTIRNLWEMGFFGKGSLSRSEPTWLDTQKRKGQTSEENTKKRREERRQVKLERARKEQQEIISKLESEKDLDGNKAEDANGHLHESTKESSHEKGMGPPTEDALKTNICDLADIASVLEGSQDTGPETTEESSNGTIQGYEDWKKTTAPNGIPTPPLTSESSDLSHVESRPIAKLQRTKSVRFSPTIEAREFDLSAPVISPLKNPGPSPLAEEITSPVPVVEQQEHLQLSLEEAFFLAYGLGVLQIFCDDSNVVLPAVSLLSLFRRHSYFPPRSLSIAAEPDDPFIISYAVYHHYRSLGWVVRSGVKFSVDYLLYNRGPAFSHADFAVVILPSYTDPYWSEQEERRERKSPRSWWWLHAVNRVQAQVKKNLVLCYVDVPPPLRETEKGDQNDVGKLFARYKIRDVNIKRWTPNRSRD